MMTFTLNHFQECQDTFGTFPLGEKHAHIGAGDYNKDHIKATDRFLKKHGGKILATKGRPIRLATPDKCKPYYSGKVVGVGRINWYSLCPTR